MDVGELGEDQLEGGEDHDEFLGGHVATVWMIDVVNSLHGESGSDLNSNVVSNGGQLLEKGDNSPSPDSPHFTGNNGVSGPSFALRPLAHCRKDEGVVEGDNSSDEQANDAGRPAEPSKGSRQSGIGSRGADGGGNVPGGVVPGSLADGYVLALVEFDARVVGECIVLKSDVKVGEALGRVNQLELVLRGDLPAEALLLKFKVFVSNPSSLMIATWLILW